MMSNDNRLLVFTSLVALIAGISVFGYLRSQQEDIVSVQHKTGIEQASTSAQVDFSQLTFTALDQKPVSLTQWQKPIVLINFWAPWCLPCRKEIPDLIALQKDYPDQLQILGLSFDHEQNVRDYQQQFGINYPLLLTEGKDSHYNKIFGNESGGLPFTIILDQNLDIKFKHTGILTKAQMIVQLEGIISPNVVN